MAGTFIKYVDIERMGSPENEGILDFENDEIVIEEKVDRGNGCVWVEGGTEEGVLHYASRNHELLPDEKTFRKQVEWLKENIKPENLDHAYFYYVEWMAKHTLSYGDGVPPVIGLDIKPKEGAFGKVPLFIGWKAKYDMFVRAGIPCVCLYGIFKSSQLTDEIIGKLTLKSHYYDGKPEGIVLKNYNRMNIYGRQMFAKIVLDEFREHNRAVFGSVKQDTSDTIKLCEMFATPARIRKWILKLENTESMPLERSMMKRLPILVCEDILKEEYSTILKEYRTISVGVFKGFVAKKCLIMIDEMLCERLVKV